MITRPSLSRFWIAPLIAMGPTTPASEAAFQRLIFHPTSAHLSSSDRLGLGLRHGGDNNHPSDSMFKIDTSNIGTTRSSTRKDIGRFVSPDFRLPPAQGADHLDADAKAETLWLPKLMGGLSLLGFTLAIWCTIGIAWFGLTFPTHLYIVPR